MRRRGRGRGEFAEKRVLGGRGRSLSVNNPPVRHLDVHLFLDDKSVVLGVIVDEIGEELDVGDDVVGEDVFEGVAREGKGRMEEGEDLGSVQSRFN